MDISELYKRMYAAKHGDRGVRLTKDEVAVLLPTLSPFVPELGPTEPDPSLKVEVAEKKNYRGGALRMHIRWMLRRHMAEVLDIERQSFEFPWSVEDFIMCLRQRNCIGMVAESGEKVHGLMIYELHKTRLHLLNFAVDPGSRMRTIGRQMVKKLTDKLSDQRRKYITLEVRETNTSALMFFKACGFQATGMIPNYYSGSDEDAIAMRFNHRKECKS